MDGSCHAGWFPLAPHTLRHVMVQSGIGVHSTGRRTCVTIRRCKALLTILHHIRRNDDVEVVIIVELMHRYKCPAPRRPALRQGNVAVNPARRGFILVLHSHGWPPLPWPHFTNGSGIQDACLLMTNRHRVTQSTRLVHMLRADVSMNFADYELSAASVQNNHVLLLQVPC